MAAPDDETRAGKAKFPSAESPRDPRRPETADPSSQSTVRLSRSSSGAKTNAAAVATPTPTPVPDVLDDGNAPPAFSPNEVVARRFKIVRFIGKGGMGEVYEAEDLELRERVALKTVRPAIAGDLRAIERFKREINLARKVTHPNVCRIFDVFRHQQVAPDGSAAREITFLSMELLGGETLARRIRSQGPMTTDEAFPIVCQMAAALDAAHRAGIVHRDFKSQNVILVPVEEPGGGARAVVTDFGLALAMQKADQVVSSSQSVSDFVGSPPYMAPEQVRGVGVTAAADIYALGVVMFEMVSGRHPFVADTPLATAAKRLTEEPPSPRSFAPGLDARWETAILRCLAREPRNRFANASDVVNWLQGREASKLRRRRRLAVALAVAASVLVVALALAISRGLLQEFHRGKPVTFTSTAPGSVTARPSVAVLGFKDLSGRAESAWLSTALSEMLDTELAAGEQLRIIPGEDVARARVGLALADTDSFSRDTLSRLREGLGTDLVVVGSYLVLGNTSDGRIRVDLLLQDARSGETVESVSENGTESNLFDLASRVGTRLRAKLGVVDVAPELTEAVRAALPTTPEATRLYAEGLAKLRVFDALAARALLERAVAADPSHALAHSALAAAWSALGYDDRARAEARKAMDLSESLTQEQRLSVEARYREMTHEWDQAIRLYESLFGFYPDSLDYGLRLAQAQVTAGKGKDALATLATLRKLPEPGRDDPRIDLVEAQADDTLGRFKEELAVAMTAGQKGTAEGAQLIVARARRAQGWAFKDLGEPDKASAAFEDARRAFAAPGDQRGVATTLNDLALIRYDQGNLEAAKQAYGQALETYRGLGDQNAAAEVLNNLGTVLWQQGDLAEAQKAYEQALATFRANGNESSVAKVLNGLGLARYKQGNFEAAKQVYGQALDTYRGLGDQNGAAAALNNLGTVLLEQGDLAGAQKMYEQALAASRANGNKAFVAAALSNLSLVDYQQGELARARQKNTEAMALFREVKDSNGAAEAQETLARELWSQGDLQGALTAGKAALEAFHGAGNQSSTAEALTTIAGILKDQGHLVGARKRLSDAMAIETRLGEKFALADSRLALAEVSLDKESRRAAESAAQAAAEEFAGEKAFDKQARAYAALGAALLAEGKLDAARAAVKQSQELLTRSQSRLVQLACGIAAAEVQAASGRPEDRSVARQSLETILSEATVRGLVGLRFEARLALGQIELSSGDAAAGRARLQTLAKEASDEGFGFVAQKAAVAQ